MSTEKSAKAAGYRLLLLLPSRELRIRPHLAAVDKHYQALSELPGQRLPATSRAALTEKARFTVGARTFDPSEIFDRLIKVALLPAPPPRC